MEQTIQNQKTNVSNLEATSQPKILIVEDESFLANVLSLRFKKENFEVIQAFDGVEALQKLQEVRPDLILLDLILPKKNGFEVLKEIENDPQIRSIPVLIVSNLGQESDITKGKSLGAIDYYVKAHLSIDELVSKVKNLLRDTSTIDN